MEKLTKWVMSDYGNYCPVFCQLDGLNGFASLGASLRNYSLDLICEFDASRYCIPEHQIHEASEI